jgi:hypothetical protein
LSAGRRTVHPDPPETAEGAKTIDVVVVHGDGTEASFQYHTDAEYLGKVLRENEWWRARRAPTACSSPTVDGETADDSLQQWWCITRSGENALHRRRQTPIADGEQYELTLTEGY